MLWYLIKVVVVYIVACVPVPSNHNFLVRRITNCSREQSSIVRHFIHSVWRPVFQKYDVKMPEQCPLHFSRDLFVVQELAKLHYRANLWTCAICGKSFYREPYLDLHLVNRHMDMLAWRDDSVCYGDFCDVFRCQGILQRRKRKRRSSGLGSFTNRQNSLYELGINVYEDIDFESDNDEDEPDPIGDGGNTKRSSNQFALMTAPPRHVLKALDEKSRHDTSERFVVGFDSKSEQDILNDPFGYNSDSSVTAPPSSSESWQSSRPRPRTSEKPGKRIRDDSDRSMPRIRHQYYDKILNKVDKFVRVATDKLKTSSMSETSEKSENGFWDDSTDCDEETMSAKHLKCQRLLHDCVSPLILHLSDEKYAKMFETLDRDLCWYLTCDRRDLFKGDSATDLPSKATHFILMVILFVVLAIFLGVLYYLVWFCF